MFKRLSGPMAVLFNEAGDGGGEGGGGGGDGKGGAGGGGAFSKEQIDAIARITNSSVTAQLKRLQLPTEEGLLGKVGTLLEEKLKGFQPAGAPDGKGGSGSGDGKGTDGVPESVKQELARMKADLEKANQRAELERKAREDNDLKARRTEERNTLAGVLRERGVPDHQVKVLVPYLHGERGVIKRAEDGSIVAVMPRPDWGKDQAEDLALDKWVDEWLGTDEGKSYLPPKPVGGSGTRGAGNAAGARRGGDLTKADLGNFLADAFRSE